MKLTILGSGTVDPQADRACSGYFLETSKGSLLLDLGNGALRRSVEFQKPVHQVETLFLSHLHPDHTADLVPLLFARKYAPPPWRDGKALTLWGPPGTSDFVHALFKVWPSIEPKDGTPALQVREYSEDGHSLIGEGVAVEWTPVEHGDMQAYALRVTDGDRTFVYSGDTKLCPGIKEAAKNADLFVCECSCFPRGCEPLYCRDVHLSWEDVAEICESAQPKKLVLTHLYKPVLAAKPNPLDSLSQVLSCPVELACDGQSYLI